MKKRQPSGKTPDPPLRLVNDDEPPNNTCRTPQTGGPGRKPPKPAHQPSSPLGWFHDLTFVLLSVTVLWPFVGLLCYLIIAGRVNPARGFGIVGLPIVGILLGYYAYLLFRRRSLIGGLALIALDTPILVFWVYILVAPALKLNTPLFALLVAAFKSSDCSSNQEDNEAASQPARNLTKAPKPKTKTQAVGGTGRKMSVILRRWLPVPIVAMISTFLTRAMADCSSSVRATSTQPAGLSFR